MSRVVSSTDGALTITITITNLKISRVKDYCQSTAVKIGFKVAYGVQDGTVRPTSGKMLY